MIGQLKTITDSASRIPVVSILGPRQSGKTTLAKHAFPNHNYVNLEYPDERSFASEDPRGFLENAGRAILDEIQYCPELFSYIQAIVDKKEENNRYVVTSSHNILLHEKISQSLAGRNILYRLLPLSIEELKNNKLNPDKYENAIFQGFYPRLFSHQLKPTEWYPSYIQTYVEKDLRQIIGVRELQKFQTMLKLCAGRIGQRINYSALAREVGVDHKTVREWLSVLEASYIVFFVQPYYKNFKKRLVKTPKLYFHDTGLACALLGIREPGQVFAHYLRGGLFENLVLSEIKKMFLNRGFDEEIYFWQNNKGQEIDCLIEWNGKLYAIEIKSAQTIHASFFENLKQFQNLADVPPERSFLIYGGKTSQKRSIARVINWDDICSLAEYIKLLPSGGSV